jgi:hypothetical protein
MTEWEFGMAIPVKSIKWKGHYIRQEMPVKRRFFTSKFYCQLSSHNSPHSDKNHGYFHYSILHSFLFQPNAEIEMAGSAKLYGPLGASHRSRRRLAAFISARLLRR